MVREVLAQHQLSAEFTLDRWHPLEGDWEDAGVPMPDTAEQRAAEHRRLVDAETQESLAAGQAGWEVRVDLPSHRQAVELAERLQAEGRPVIRRWKYLMLGANNEDDASALAEAIGQEVPARASVYIQAIPFVDFDDSKPETSGTPSYPRRQRLGTRLGPVDRASMSSGRQRRLKGWRQVTARHVVDGRPDIAYVRGAQA